MALITGAAGGIGAAIANRLGELGYQLSLTDLQPGTPPAADAIWTAADVADEQAIRALCEATSQQFGHIDVVIHAAGQVGSGPLAKVSHAQWQRLLDVNLTSAFLLTKYAYPTLKARHGRVVLFSSSNGLNGGSAYSGPAYAVAKAGIINLCRYLGKEWASDGIRINCIAPGPVDTPMLDRLGDAGKQALRDSIPLGKLATTDHVTGTVEYLLSPSANMLTGTVHNISGGLVLD